MLSPFDNWSIECDQDRFVNNLELLQWFVLCERQFLAWVIGCVYGK